MGFIHRFPTGEYVESPSEDASDDALVAALADMADELGIAPQARPNDLEYFDRAIIDDDFAYMCAHTERLDQVRKRIGEIALFVLSRLGLSESSPFIGVELPNVRYVLMGI